MSSSIPPPLPSPGVGARRKGAKAHPKLPLSAFSPPNTGTSGDFPLPPSPSSIRPSQIIDSHVVATGGDFSSWEQAASSALEGKAGGAVASLHGTDPTQIESAIEKIRERASSQPILAILVPYNLEDGAPTSPPSYLEHSSMPGPRIVLSAVYTKYSAAAVDALRWAIEKGFTVDLPIETNLRAGEGAWEDLEELLNRSLPDPSSDSRPAKIIISNILPPPDDLSLPIVALLTHPTYQVYQAQIAALSLYSGIYVKFVLPAWDIQTYNKSEWKRRVKMYIGPALEAFGFERLIWGSRLPSSSTISLADWYELARELWAELGVETEAMEAIFHQNAKRVYDS